VPVTFLIVLAYLAYDRLWRRGDLPSLLAAAAITGAAFSTHDYAIFLAIPLAWSAARGARNTGDAIRRIAVAVVTQPYSVPIEPTAEVRREAVGRFVPTKTALQIARGPYPKTAYRLI
jgi:hypothetical protein